MFGGKKYDRLSRQILSFWNGYYETVRPMYLYTYDGIGPMVYKTNNYFGVWYLLCYVWLNWKVSKSIICLVSSVNFFPIQF